MIFLEEDRPSVHRRFMEKVHPEPNSGCWLWTASLNKHGYGGLMMRHTKRSVGAHRVSYQLFVADVPVDADILHSCDTPCCVNPDHLSVGTAKDNMLDMMARGRRKWKRGEESASCKLADAKISEIKATRGSLRAVASRYGISHTYVRQIRNGYRSQQ